MSKPVCLFEWRLKPELHKNWHQPGDCRWTDYCRCKDQKQVKKMGCPAHDRKKAEVYIEKMTVEPTQLFEFRWKEIGHAPGGV